MNEPPCCSPSRPPIDEPSLPPTGGRGGVASELLTLPGGRFRMGTDDDRFPADGEGPIREVEVGGFEIAPTAVTTAEFADFVSATAYTTIAEREGWSFVFGGLLPDDFPPTRGVVGAEWWRAVEGADWRHPEGPQSDLDERGDHPVVHVSWLDAMAYAEWVGGRLPTEAEWEYAARGGLDQAIYAWGDELTPDGTHRCNIWQGVFPVDNSLDDGWLGTSPVRAFAANAFGLHDVAGNVWEWCADWFDPVFHVEGQRRDPVGPQVGQQRVIRGGSYLCHDSYCNRYRVGARSSNSPDSSTGNMGFRIAR